MNTILLFLHNFINLFAAGRSNAKIVLFLIFIFGTLVLFFISKKVNKVNNGNKIKRALRNCIFVVSTLFVMGIFVHVHIYNTHAIPILDRVIYFSDEEISSSTITHLHEMKSTFGLLFVHVNSFFENLDPGIATITFVNPYISVIAGILLIVAIYLYARLCYLGFFSTWKEALLGGVVAFILIKNTFDGGLLNFEVAATILFIVFWYKIPHRMKLAALALPLVVFNFVHSFYTTHFAKTFLFLTVLHILLFEKRIWLRVLAAVLGCLLYIVMIIQPLNYMRLVPVENNAVTFASFNVIEGQKVLYRVGNLFVYSFVNTPIQYFIDTYNVHYSYKPASIEWQTCLPLMFREYGFSLISGDEDVSDGAVKDLYKDHYYKLSLVYSEDTSRWDGTVRFSGCQDVLLENQIQEGLRELDMLPAILINIQSRL